MSGLFGLVERKNCSATLFYGTDYHSHLGTQKAGLAILNHRIYRSIHDISVSQFKSKFADEIEKMAGRIGIGVISDNEPQPIIISSSFGTFTLATSGFISNKKQLAREVMRTGGSFSELSGGTINPTEVAGKIIAQKESVIEGIKYLFEKVRGSLSLLLLNKEGIYAARDKQGRTGLAVGRRNRDIAIASESCSFPNLGYHLVKELGPKEVVLIDTKGSIKTILAGAKKESICAFLWIYTGYPASSYNGISVEAVRERCGINLAKRDNLKADFVTGIPDSGIAHGLGYAIGAGIPYRRAFVKYTPGYGRSYTPPSQKVRDKIAQMKLIAIEKIIKGKKIIICDDSIVRGTQLKNQAIKKLWRYGAEEIHVRIACPPLMFPCAYLFSTRTKKELAARRAIRKVFGKRGKSINLESFLNEKSEQYRKMVDQMRKELGVTTLRFQTVNDMIDAIGLPKERLCLHCWIGKS
ncbi:MAG: amidophosphoribosyltransferase [Patescibacteria group bacterium]|nr:amidophosphoribosyltransferase [Patescibacteria group bacterium]